MSRAVPLSAVPAPKPKKAKPVRLTDEHSEQCLLFAWAAVAANSRPELAALYAVPNFARVSPRWGAWMKAEGKRAGVPDVHLPVARGGYSSLYVELKVKPNKVTPEQEVWHERLRALGNRVEVCWSWIEAREILEAYLDNRIGFANLRAMIDHDCVSADSV